jgi:hypothetical protein
MRVLKVSYATRHLARILPQDGAAFLAGKLDELHALLPAPATDKAPAYGASITHPAHVR